MFAIGTPVDDQCHTAGDTQFETVFNQSAETVCIEAPAEASGTSKTWRG